MTATETIDRAAAAILAKRLNGEDPRNDMTRWERRAAVGMGALRDEVEATVRSVREGRMDAAAAAEILEACDRAISAFVWLNGQDS